MPELPSPFQSPTLRADRPSYPLQLQLLRVTSTVIPGPFNVLGSGGAQNVRAALYVSAVQQVQTDILFPRDREPCLALDVNGLGLAPGLHLGRLCGNYTSIPVYSVVDNAAINLAGLTQAQINLLLQYLSLTQLGDLYNLTPCQMAVFVQLTGSQMQMLTSSFSPAQLTEVIDAQTVTQFQALITSTTPAQLLQVVSSMTPTNYLTLVEGLPINQLIQLIQSLTQQQVTELAQLTQQQIQNLLQALTVTQILTLLTSLTVQQVQNLTLYEPFQIQTLVNNLTLTQLGLVLTPGTPGRPLPQPFGDPLVPPEIPLIFGFGSSAPSKTIPGFIPVEAIADPGGTTGIYGYTGGSWTPLGGTTTASGGTVMVEGIGTTTDAFVTIANLDVTSAKGLLAQIGVKNTGATNSLTVQVVFTDAFGGTNTSTPTSATPGGIVSLSSTSSSTRFPVTRVQVQVKSASPGNATTYDGKMSYVG